MKNKLANEWRQFILLLKSVPPVIFSLFVLAVFAMNLLANKSINFGVDWLVIDCGTLLSWLAFLCMDVLTRHFGPKAATQISLFALLVNLVMCLVMFGVSKIAGNWSQAMNNPNADVINGALNGTFGGAWQVVLGSAVAFAASSALNNFVNYGVGKLFTKNPNGFAAYACRTYVSTAVGQFADNFVFALLVGHFFFGWTIAQCLVCATTTMLVELILEIAFSPIGYKVCKRWQKDGVGAQYLQACATTAKNN